MLPSSVACGAINRSSRYAVLQVLLWWKKSCWVARQWRSSSNVEQEKRVLVDLIIRLCAMM